jgi:hypothetical protein
LISSSVDGEYISQQCVQSLRARRCASTADTAEPVRNGSTPISFRRVIAPGRVVRVQRREHEVAGEGGLDRDLGRLAVADLADHHHVRVGAQDRPQRGREREPGARVDLHLVDSRGRNSTGSSTVMMLISGRLISVSAA